MKNTYSVLPACLILLAACAPRTVPRPQAVPPAAQATAPCNLGEPLVNAALWMQSSAEYRAAALQTYAAARRALQTSLAANDADKRPTAIILDLDETSLNNIRFEARMIRQGTNYTPQAWKQWVDEAAAGAVPGAVEFLQWADSQGVTPFYITNRTAAEEPATRANLRKLGFPLRDGTDTLLTRGEKPEWKPADKTPRRIYVARGYRVIALFGDDLNDFVDAATKSESEREAVIRSNQSKWGSEWFMLPNPAYGSWERAATGNASGCEQLNKKIEALQP